MSDTTNKHSESTQKVRLSTQCAGIPEEIEGPPCGSGHEEESPHIRTIADDIRAFKEHGTSPLLKQALSRLIDLRCPRCGERIGTELDV